MRLYFAIVVTLLGTTVAAAAAGWQIADRQGTVLVLEGKQWDYLPEDGKVDQGVAIRTLKNSTVTLQSDGYVLELQSNSAARIERSVKNTAVLTQFAGVITIQTSTARGERLQINAGGMAVYVEPGSAALTIHADTGQVEVSQGLVMVLDARTKAETAITAGGTFVATAPAIAPTSNTGGNGQAVGNGATSAASSNNNNAGGNGNGAGSSNSKAGGNSTGNTGGNGNGNGNAGSNGNSNAGSNGNGNASGNGRGDGNSSASAQGNGNGSGNSENNNAGGNSSNSQTNNGNGNGASNEHGNAGANSAANGNGSGNSNGKGNGNRNE
ncbi:MAG: hypothetical protein ACTHLT_07625 [Devosia sp.]